MAHNTETTKAPQQASSAKAPSTQPPPPAKRFAINHDASSPLRQRLAQELYESYIANSDGLNYEGKPCPPWDKLGDAVRSHWCAVTKKAMQLAIRLHPSEVDLEAR